MNAPEKNIHVAITHNDAYTEHCVVCICSILENKKENEKITFHIIDGGLSEFSKGKIVEIANKYENSTVEFNKIDNSVFEGYKKADYYPVQILWTMILPEIDGLKELKKLIYLDCDLVVHSSLGELWDLELDDNYIGAVEDANGKKYSKRFLDGKEKFFNTGTMVINCEKWRADDIPRRAVEDALKNTGGPLGYDQTVLNKLFVDKVKYLDLKWNLQYSPINVWAQYDDIDEYKRAVRNPSIIHYVGDYKPWTLGLGCFNPKQKDYFKYHKLTSYKKENYPLWLLKDKMLSGRGLVALIKRYPTLLFKRTFWAHIRRGV